MGMQRLGGYLHFNFVIGAPSQHEGIMETWSIVIQVSFTLRHSFVIVMKNI
jgi:hypothetical protein